MDLRRGLLGALLFACPLLLGQRPVPTQETPAALGSTKDAGLESTPESPESVVDGIMAGLFEAHHLAGAVVTVVRDGQPLLSKGYGFADLEERRPVDPASTLFRIASVSKLLTWTAVMQLEERRQLQLNTDVNEYLETVAVPSNADDPVTLASLMTHTAGFEDRILGLITSDTSSIVPFDEILQEGLPSRILPPGRVPAYSNYGAALAALVVQDVAGMPWDRFVRTNILDPLDMSHTVLAQPVPQPESADLALGYGYVNGALAARPFEVVPLLPAGGVSASASDMARFMMAYLNLGQLDGATILGEETVLQMQQPLWQPDPRIPGIAYGFARRLLGGRLVLGHSGDLRYFHSSLTLVPSERLGLFVSFNSEEGAAARDEFVDAIYEHWFPEHGERPAASSTLAAADRVSALTGYYRSTRRPSTTVDKLAEVLGYMTVSSLGEGRILTRPLAGETRQWVEVEPNFFRARDREGRLLFQSDSGDGSVRAFLGDEPFWAFDRLVWYQEPTFQLSLLAAEIVVFLSALIFPFVRRYFERDTERMLGRRQPAHPLARALASSISLVDLAFLIGLIVVLQDPGALLAGIPPGLPAILVLPLIGGALTVLLLVVTFFAWRGGFWNWAARLHFSLVAAAALAFLWQANYWNLLGWQYP